MNVKTKLSNRLVSVFLCIALLMSYLPMSAFADSGYITTIADPETLTRPETIYGDSTVNAGKITVGKSVSDKDITVNGQRITLDGDNNFLVTISQSAQVMGLASKSSVPVDVVFVLDTSGSMKDNDRATTMVSAANSAINTLMANEQNRVAVVAFSSEDYGEGTSGGAAANVLSSLAHYDGDAATSHLRWVSSNGSVSSNSSNNVYIAGRDNATYNNRSVNAFRNGKSGGTNIQAGIAEGAKILTSVSNTVYVDPETNENITRIPFLIILSDGQPTFTYDDDTWYDPTMTGTNAAEQQGPGDESYEGNGFMAAMTAAYYKGKITEHYYGDEASDENRCYVYTMGVQISSLTGDDAALAQITLDPKTYTTGDYAASNANSYWNYGNTFNGNNKNSYYGWKSYWNNYMNEPAADFGVRVDSGGDGMWVWTGNGAEEAYYELDEPKRPTAPRRPNSWASQAQWDSYYAQLEEYEIKKAQYDIDIVKYNEWLEWREDNFTQISGEHYTFTAESIADSKKYVNGVGYNGGIAYNDQYFGADKVSDMQKIFEELVRTIQQKAISVPTKVTTGNHDFDGYVTFTDPIGEYMEVKDMKGIVAGGYFYQGASFAEKLSKYGTNAADQEFDELILDVVKTRMHLTSSVVDVEDFIAKMKASNNQAYYNSPDDYDNSMVWWGNSYNSGEEDEQVQVLGFADNDTIEYIENQKAAKTIPEGADLVCRSYFFYGEAGGANPNPEQEYLYFMVRVQRELTAPYKETVVISAPASLLSMEKVFIEESYDENGDPVYKATVEHQEPARVVYEVGLWDTINRENVSYIVSPEYTAEKVNGVGSVNYDPATDTYHFFTNDWDRTQSLESHHRAQAKATFDAAADNAFYTYQENTLLLDKNGDPVTADPKGKTAYYIREYFEWSDSKTDGTYAAEKKSTLVKVDIPADAVLIEDGGKWYIPKGTYTAATLVVNGDDTMKDDPDTSAEGDGNLTGTSSIVAHPHRTGASNNSHYTVFLGNNGKLSLEADPYEPTKTASVNLRDNALGIVDDEGKPVLVGDELTYTVEVKNVLTTAADITVTDYVPLGTQFVEGSAGVGTRETGHTTDASIKPDSNNVLTWIIKDVPAGEVRYVSFKTVVTEAAFSLNVVPSTIDNTATVQIGNTPAVTTNTTHNPPYGKMATDVNNQNIDGEGGLKVGDTVVYHIRVHNNATDASGNFVVADATVTDKLPEGTTFVSADNGGKYDEDTGVVTWKFEDMAANSAKIVSVTVKINAAAKSNGSGTQPESGEISVKNTADIVIDNGHNIELETNTTENLVDTGDMVITKTVAQGGDTDKRFAIKLSEATGTLDGTYVLLRGNSDETVIFTEGKATVYIKHGETLTVKGLPAGAIISVAEDISQLPGWTPTYNTQSVTVVKGAATTVSSVSITNTYTLKPLTLTLKGEKDMKGSMPSDTTFGFIAVPDSNNPVVGDSLTGEVTVKASGKYEFEMSSKTFTKPGVYKYTVYEINGGVDGVEYSGERYALEINVIDNGDGTMRAEAKLDNNAFDIKNEKVSFTNTYTPDDVPLTVIANKTLMVYDEASGSYKKADVSAGQFRFNIKDKATGNTLAIGTNAADGSITFNTFYFSADMLGDKTSKDFTFVVSEVVPELNRDPNMLYHTRGIEFSATLTLSGGKLTVSVDGDTDGKVDLRSSVNFVNYSNPDSVTVVPYGKKVTTGGNLPAGLSFSFKVLPVGSSTDAATGTSKATVGGNPSETSDITFTSMVYTNDSLGGAASKTYSYWIKESNAQAGNVTGNNGVTYDRTRYLYKVTLSRNEYGRLIATESYYKLRSGGNIENEADYTVAVDEVNIVFNNVYAAKAHINLTAEKELSGRGHGLAAGEFDFVLRRLDAAGKLVAGSEISGSNNASGAISFATLNYSDDMLRDAYKSSDGSYYFSYLMKEIEPEGVAVPGVTYDKKEYVITIKVTQTAGGMTAQLANVSNAVYSQVSDSYTPGTAVSGFKADGATNVTFKNTYATVKGDTVKFTVKKTLSGRDLREGEFDFELLYNGNSVNIATNDAKGNVTFTLNVAANTKPGVYEFTVKESHGALAGVTYDTNSYKIYVKVTDDGKGNIVAQLQDASGVPYAEVNGVVDLTGSIHFRNTYVPKYAVVQLEADKTLSGRELNDKEFSFVVRKDNVNGDIVATGSNAKNGKILFSTFDITAKDMAGATDKTFTYVITESDNNVPGVTVDKSVYTVTVRVTDDGNGALNAVVTYPNNAPIVFKNTYRPDSTRLPITAFKNLTGKNLADKEFTFELRDGDNKLLQTKYNDKNGTITFDDLEFTAEDMVDSNGKKVMSKKFVYKISEKEGDVETMVYDTNVYTVTVTVTDDGKGNLKATAAYKDLKGDVELIVFNNSYTPSAATAELEGTKVIVDTNGNPLTDAKYSLAGFEFEVRDANGKLVTTATSDDKGNIKFTGFEFTEAGEYRFLISEKATTRMGYTIDPTVWCVHITISYNADTGVLYESNEFIHIAPETHDGIASHASGEISFKNVYDPADINLTIKALKKLSGRELRENEFTFCIADANTGLRVSEAKNNANGEISFHLTYKEAGTYKYTVYEVVPDKAFRLGGIGYSNEKYTVEVVVSDDGSGALKAVVDNKNIIGTDSVDMSDELIFNNTYKPDAVDVVIEATKLLEGKALKADMFEFTLVNDADANESYSAKNLSNGTVKFDAITFDKVGTYKYTLSEVKGNAGGITYDEHKFGVTVVVTDDGEGKLHAATHYTNSAGGTEAAPVFRNTYKAAPTEYIPEIKKIYEGGSMLTFNFELSGEGFETQTKQNDANGDVTFDKLVFDKAGRYTFTITEKADPSIEDIRWDTNVYTLTVDVTDNMNGQLGVDNVDVTSNNGRTDLVFRNVHEDLITDKDVYYNDDSTFSIDGNKVEKGDILTYTITYKNYTGLLADVTITDTIPEHTEYVEGSANEGGVYAGGVITWNITDIPSDETVTVSFKVKVTGGTGTVSNKANVLEGSNNYETETVTNTIGEDKVEKDVFAENEPTVSIDGEKVEKGDILLYKITYTNSDDFGAEVTITDIIPEYTEYVESSADNGATFDDGKLTWKLSLTPNESKTVSFKVRVVGSNITLTNKASALEGGNTIETNTVKNPVPEDVFVKDVFVESEPTVSIDGESVKKGDILTYTLTYTNSYEAAAEVTIVDTIPEYTEYIEGSADNGATFDDGKLTWKLSLSPSESKTVSFKVEVIGSNIAVENKATALEGNNSIDTNTVSTPVPEDIFEKDVFAENEPTVSIDGNVVKKGDVLIYTLTYTNSYEAAAEVTIVDTIPEHTAYVDGSADNGGVYEDGKLTWKLSLLPNESKTVSFKVEVKSSDATVVNQATALEGNNKVDSNPVTNKAKEEPPVIPEVESPKTGDTRNLHLWIALLFVSGGGILGTVALRLRRKESEQN